MTWRNSFDAFGLVSEPYMLTWCKTGKLCVEIR